MNDAPIWLAVETGGTKLIARMVQGDTVIATQRWPTTTPDEALGAILNFVAGAKVAAAGIAAFGPIVIDASAATYGEVLATPKPGWSGANLRAALADELHVPVAVDTDVNAAALAEARIGAGQGCATVVYVTVGTGIGAGLAQRDAAGNWRTLGGALHPELGHVPIVRAITDGMASLCPFHAHCAEGLAAGPAVKQRTGGAPLEADPAAFAIEADYLGQLFATIVLAWSPHRIVVGGGVLNVPGLREAAAERMTATLGGYGVGPFAGRPDFIVPPALEDAGLEGALLLAQAATD